MRWGEPRTTLDVDMTLLTGWGSEEPYVTALLERFRSRTPGGFEFAMEHRVILVRATNGCDVDIALGALPFEAEMVRRATREEYAPGLCLPCCTAEDLFVMKVFAGRPRDWLDAESIVLRQTHLDRPYMLHHLSALFALKESPQELERAVMLLQGPGS